MGGTLACTRWLIFPMRCRARDRGDRARARRSGMGRKRARRAECVDSIRYADVVEWLHGRHKSKKPSRKDWARRRPFGPPYTTRTCDLRLRRPLLYPAELRAENRSARQGQKAAARIRRDRDFTSFAAPLGPSSSHRLRMHHEPAEEEDPRDHAIHTERRELAVAFEVAHQEAHAEIRRNARQHAAQQ